MSKRNFTCLYCGTTFTPKYAISRNKHPKYCTLTCFHRRTLQLPLYHEAIELCRTGFNLAEAAKQVGVEYDKFARWVNSHGRDMLSGRVCGFCGKSLDEKSFRSNRRYCSKNCGKKAWYLRKHPIRKKNHDPKLRDEALELYWGGLNQRLVADYLGIPHGTVHYWVHCFGKQRARIKTEAALKLIPPQQQLGDAKTASEWLNTLKNLAPDTLNEKTPPIHLVCKKIHGGSGGIGQLGSIIYDDLRQNALSGDTFAFCCKDSTVIIVMSWKETMFSITKLPRQYGTYLWPREDFGPSITVSAHEFEFLLTCYTYERMRIKNAMAT